MLIKVADMIFIVVERPCKSLNFQIDPTEDIDPLVLLCRSHICVVGAIHFYQIRRKHTKIKEDESELAHLLGLKV